MGFSIYQVLTKRQTEIIRLLRSVPWCLVLNGRKRCTYKRDTEISWDRPLPLFLQKILIWRAKGTWPVYTVATVTS